MTSMVDVLSLAMALPRHRNLSRAELEAFQARRLQRLVAHAYARVPFYRALFDRHGIQPAAIRTPGDLAQVPVTSKTELRAAPVRDLLVQGHDPARLIEQRTSGSSGQRLTVYRTWLEQRVGHLFRLRAVAEMGVRPRDVTAHVGLHHAPNRRDVKLIGNLARRAGFSRRVLIDLFSSPADQAAQLRAARPDVLSGYPGAIGRLAAYLLDAGIDDLRPRLVLVGAEVLTPELRRTIAAAFAAPVIDMYGSHEFNLLGWECQATGSMHLTDDALLVEVLKDGRPARPGETGEVVVTALHLYAMPLIRYRLGDLATRGDMSCLCGAPWSTIREIQGRTVDWFTLADGRVLHPYQILQEAFAGRTIPARQYQLVQEASDRIVLRLAVPPDAPTGAMLEAETVVRAFLGPRVDFRVEIVPEIAPEANGKCRALRVDPAALVPGHA
jgi:phenylacetate-CoA ligase